MVRRLSAWPTRRYCRPQIGIPALLCKKHQSKVRQIEEYKTCQTATKQGNSQSVAPSRLSRWRQNSATSLSASFSLRTDTYLASTIREKLSSRRLKRLSTIRSTLARKRALFPRFGFISKQRVPIGTKSVSKTTGRALSKNRFP